MVIFLSTNILKAETGYFHNSEDIIISQNNLRYLKEYFGMHTNIFEFNKVF